MSPGNPLKSAPAAGLGRRLAAAAMVADHPRIVVTGVEAAFGTRFTADTLRRLLPLRPGVRFVWLMGADNLAGFHRWRDWQEIAARLPIAVIDRPGAAFRALAAPAARALTPHRLHEAKAAKLAGQPAPAWVFLHGPRSPESSTALRHAPAARPRTGNAS